MAVDTRSKRASVLGIALAINLTLPEPSAGVSIADRQSVTYCYSGIEVSGFPEIVREANTDARLSADLDANTDARLAADLETNTDARFATDLDANTDARFATDLDANSDAF